LNPGAFVIPGVLDRNAGIIGEVKNVGYLSFTKQLRDYAAYAEANKYKFILTTRQRTQFTNPLQTAIDTGRIIWRQLKW
jgi:hypothetical protein